MKHWVFGLAVCLITSQSGRGGSGGLFQLISPEIHQVNFHHPFEQDHDRAYLFDSGYAVGAICLGDVNGDDILDIYCVSTSKQNRLFVGTEQGVYQQGAEIGSTGSDFWGTGANLVDIDNDGDLDLYQCNYDAPNQLYLNDGQGGFTELQGAAGLAVRDASIAASFADVDGDGDLDMFLLCNRYYSPTGRPAELPVKMVAGEPQIIEGHEKYLRLFARKDGSLMVDEYGRANYFFLNEGKDTNGNLTFRDVSQSSGLRQIGHGLSCIWWDIDEDGDLDLYVANDFSDQDQLYLNSGVNKHGVPKFENVHEMYFPAMPWFSMGGDVADVNNDGLADLMSLDMSATTHFKSKTNMGELTPAVRTILEDDWPKQSMRNHLYINTGSGFFKETAFASGLPSTDWSWVAKFGDLDNDGMQDLFISNGMARNFTDADRVAQVGSKKVALVGRTTWDHYKDDPPMLEENLVFQNIDGGKFKKRSDWGLGLLGMSYSAAMGDLDNDGDLDLVVSDLGENIKIYENQGAGLNSLRVKLTGTKSNRMGIGAKAVVSDSLGVKRTRWMNPWTGFQGQNDTTLHFGLGAALPVKLEVFWPSGMYQEYVVKEGEKEVSLEEAPTGKAPTPPVDKSRFSAVEAPDFVHKEKRFDDFKVQPLIPSKHSQEGPCIAAGDIDGDGDDDFYVGGAAGQSGALYINDNGSFSINRQPAFSGLSKYAEDVAALWFDADGDQDLDLIVVTGSSEYEADDVLHHDRLYLNDGSAHEVKLTPAPDGAFPKLTDSGSCVVASDYDEDGDLDLFIGSRLVPGKYPTVPENRLLRNDSQNGEVKFTEITPEGLKSCGMVTGAEWGDLDNDGDVDLALAVDWGAVTIFRNDRGVLSHCKDAEGISKYKGWWRSIHAADVDGDGDLDLVAGNVGINTKYKKPSDKKQAKIYYGDMDGSGVPRIVEAKKGKDVHNRERPLPVRGRF